MGLSVLKYFLLSFFLSVAISPLRGYDLAYSSLCGFVVYFLLTLVCLKKVLKTKSILLFTLALVGGFWVIQLPIRIMAFETSLVSLPDAILASLGIAAALAYRLLREPFRNAIPMASFILVIFMCFQGYGYWIHKLNFGTFTGRIEP